MVGMVFLAIILLPAPGYAELLLVDDFDGMSIGNLGHNIPTVGGGGILSTNTGGTSGNIYVETNSGSNVVRFMTTTDGANSRGFGVAGLDNTIEDTQKGLLFFRFSIRVEGNAADTYFGLHALSGDTPFSVAGNNPENYIVAGFRAVNGTGTAVNLVRTKDAGTVLKADLTRGQWYNCWIDANNATNTFGLYISAAAGPAGAATLPTPADKVGDDLPFENTATYGASPLTGAFFCTPRLSSTTRSTTQSARAFIDEIYWDGDAGLNLITKAARNPVPAHRATQVPIDQTLSWDAPNDPNVVQVLGYDVYLDPNEANVTSGKLSVRVSTGQTVTSFDPVANFLYNTRYFWRVDSKIKLNDPNQTQMVAPGTVWSFTCESSAPVITQQPAAAVVAAGATAAFTVTADSVFPLSYQWYKSSDAANNTFADDVLISGATAATLARSSVSTADEGFYYCKVTNPTVAFSNAAALGVKRTMAHWTLDGLVGGQYQDSSGQGHHADPNGTPVFVSGANPALTSNGVVVNASNGWAGAGTWNPSQFTGQLTFSVWAKWAGQPATPVYQGLIGKRNTWAAAEMMWQLEIANNAASLLAFKNVSYTVNSPILPLNEWEQVTVTVSGTTATVYRNGVTAAGGTFAFNAGTGTALMLGAVGRDPALTVPTAPFNGVLDDIRIYNYAMDAIEAAYLYADSSGKSVCVSPNNAVLLAYDFNKNCKVDIGDLVALASQWLYDQLVP